LLVRIWVTLLVSTNSLIVAFPFAFEMLDLHQVLALLICQVVLLVTVRSQVSPAMLMLKDNGVADNVTSGSTGSTTGESFLHETI
jgi:hypothetical protein